MTIEKQVVSLEPAKRLKNLGVKQESLFYWHKLGGHEPAVIRHDVSADNHNTIASAFTVAELGSLFEKCYSIDFIKAYCEIVDLAGEDIKPAYMANVLMNEPDIGAKMLIYLLENQLITL